MNESPDKPLAAAFDDARGWVQEQERLLTERQRTVYDEMKNRQTLQRRQEQERLEAYRAQFEDHAKKKKLKTELALKPPVAVKDPNIERQIQNIQAAESRLESMDRAHAHERIEALKKFDQEREQQKTKSGKDLSASWRDALARTVEEEKGRGELGKDFDKSR